MANYLAAQLEDDRIDRQVKTGSKDRGDITGVRHMGAGVAIECKDYGGRILASTWLGEAEIARGNRDAASGLVFAKRRGTTNPGDQFVLMTARDLVALMTGTRPDDEDGTS